MRTIMVRKGSSILLRQGKDLRVFEYPDKEDVKIHDFKTEREVIEFMGILDGVLIALKNEGYKVCEVEDILDHVDFLGSANLFARDENFKVEYFKDGSFKLETTWSNQEMTNIWLERANKIYSIIEKATK